MVHKHGLIMLLAEAYIHEKAQEKTYCDSKLYYLRGMHRNKQLKIIPSQGEAQKQVSQGPALSDTSNKLTIQKKVNMTIVMVKPYPKMFSTVIACVLLNNHTNSRKNVHVLRMTS